jgi:hypothetical protein
MNQWIRLAAKFYPPSWRQRYGVEFDALLDDSRSGWRDVVDVFTGAMRMQMSTWSYRNMTAACGLAGLVLAAGIAFQMPNRYVSRAMFHMIWNVINENSSEKPLHDGEAWNVEFKQLVDKAFSRGSLAAIVQRPDLDLYKQDRTSKPLEDVIDQMKRRDIRIDIVNTNSHAMNFVLSFNYPDPVIAQKTAMALITRLVDANQELATKAAGRKTGASLDLLDPASLPRNPTTPNRWQIAFVGLAAGVLAGILAVMVRRKVKTQ